MNNLKTSGTAAVMAGGSASAPLAMPSLQRCVSLANGSLTPDQRVNYEFGLVLGVDEFRQEQLYFLEKDRLHQRSLHGYGTVYGLAVTATRPADNSDEMLITVEPGVAVDQFGRTIVLREEQCARLGAWLGRQIQEGKAPPRPVAADGSPPTEGDYRAYVVLSYDECEDALVPVPGEPCGSSDVTQAASRIRDSFRVELRWQPPAASAWDAVRELADLLAQVRFEPGLAPELSDEAALIDLVRGLADPAEMAPCEAGTALSSPPGGSPPESEWVLPLESARAALDRIFTVWVTEVRPRIQRQVNLTDPGDDLAVESGVLLACVDFAPVDGFEQGQKIDHATIGNDGRPFLLHTQLIQELLRVGADAEQHQRTFATVELWDSHTLRAWLHYPNPLQLGGSAQDAVRVVVEGAELALASVQPAGGAPDIYDIVTADGDENTLEPGDPVEVRFLLDGWQEVAATSGATLREAVKHLQYAYEDIAADWISSFLLVEDIAATRDLVSYTAERMGESENAQLVLWFHTDEPVRLTATQEVGPVIRPRRGRPDRPGGPQPLNRPAITVRREPGGDPLSIQIVSRPGGQTASFEWVIAPGEETAFNPDDRLIVEYDTREVGIGEKEDQTLAKLIDQERLAFLGYDGENTIFTYTRVQPPQVIQVPEPPPVDIDAIVRQVVETMPAQPLVTITARRAREALPGSTAPQQGVGFELWFNLDVDPRVDTFHIQETPSFQMLAEIEPSAAAKSPLEIKSFQLLTRRKRNVFYYFITDQVHKAEGNSSPYLRFVFPTPDNVITNDAGDTLRLAEYIQKIPVKFTGHNGKDTIVAFVRVPDQGVTG